MLSPDKREPIKIGFEPVSSKSLVLIKPIVFGPELSACIELFVQNQTGRASSLVPINSEPKFRSGPMSPGLDSFH